MSLYNKVENNLEILGLNLIKANLGQYITFINDGKKDIVEALYELTNFEIELRKERAMNACVKVANFPAIKTFEDFNFEFQPSINKEQITNFKYLKFIENHENFTEKP